MVELSGFDLVAVVGVFLIGVYAVWQNSSGFRYITLPVVFLCFFVGYVWMPALALHLRDLPLAVGSFHSSVGMTRILLLSDVSIAGFAFGVYVVGALGRIDVAQAYTLWNSKRWINDLATIEGRVAMIVLALIGFGLALTFFGIEGIPMLSYFDALKSDKFFRVMSEARRESLEGSGYFLQGITILLPTAVLLMLVDSVARRSNGARLVSIFCAAMVIFMMVSLTSRGHFAIFLILLVLTYQLVRRVFPAKAVGIAFTGLLFLFVITSLIKFGEIASENIDGSVLIAGIDILLHRLSLGALQAAALVEIFPNEQDFMMGLSYLWDLAALLPGADVGFNRWAFNLLYPSSAVPSNLTPTILGESFANFGTIGVFGVAMLIGGVLQIGQLLILREVRLLSTSVFLTVGGVYVAKSGMNGLGAMFEPLAAITMAYVLYVMVVEIVQRISWKARLQMAGSVER